MEANEMFTLGFVLGVLVFLPFLSIVEMAIEHLFNALKKGKGE
jgi:hypothetical protein